MPIPESWSGEAFNQVSESENRIHSDEVARAYGFRGALVPGVTVSAYLIHPAVEAWGAAWLERGSAHVVVHSPVYDRETFRVKVVDPTDVGYEAELSDDRDTRCASAQVELPTRAPEPPKRRGDPPLSPDADRPVASREVMEALRDRGLASMHIRWTEKAEISRYLRDPEQMPALFREQGLADPSFVLGLTNWVLSRSVRMSPWLHLQTDSQNYRSISMGTSLVVEAAIVDLFEKKGHEFVDVDVAVFDEADDTALSSARLRAIYKMRDV
jgi:hypothetical protein